MRVGVSLLNFRPGRIGGAETYLRKLVEFLPKLAGNDEIVFFVTPENHDIVGQECEKHCFNHSDRYIIAWRLIEAFTHIGSPYLKKMFRDAKLDVILFPQQSLFPVLCDIPSVLIVPDIQHIIFPQYFSMSTKLFRKTIYNRSVRLCDGIISISQFTADSLVQYCGVDANKIRPIRLGLDLSGLDNMQVVTPDIDGPYYYFPAASFPHKGHETLFRSLAKLRNDGHTIHKIILTGQKTEHWAKIENTIRKLGLQDLIIHLGFVSYKQVMGLYANAEAVLFPTEYEGFGLPVLEAAHFKRKVICSKLPIFTELGIPDELQINFNDPVALWNALQLNTTTVLTRQPATWEEMAAQTLEYLRTIGSKHKQQ